MNSPRTILIVQLKRAGDVIVTTPVIEGLKRRYPEASIDFMTLAAFAPLLDHNPWLRRVRVYDSAQPLASIAGLRRERYDWLLDFQSSPRSALVARASAAAVTAGYRVPFWGHFYCKTVPRPRDSQSVIEGKLGLVESLTGESLARPDPAIYLVESERRWAEQFDEAGRGRTRVGIVPTHRRASRRWIADGFVGLTRRLVECGCQCLWFWGPGEEDFVRSLQAQAPGSSLIPATSLRQMAALLATCQAVASNDNGPMHLAAAVGTPTVTLYGPTDPRSWNPGGPRHRVLQATGLSCLGCNLNDCPFGHECMTGISVEQVAAVVEDVLRLAAVGSRRA